MKRVALVLLVSSVSCSQLPQGVFFKCEADGGCLQAGFVCTAQQLCEPHDAGAVDADSGVDPLDAGVDGGVSDAGLADFDAGLPDAGADDAGRIDGGSTGCRTTCSGQCGFEPLGPNCVATLCGSCAVGNTCTQGQCSLQPACSDGWCAEYPLPQGNHLYAVWADPGDAGLPLPGAPIAAWGGERGVLFEWDGVTTRFTPLPRADGTIIGFARFPQSRSSIGLIAVTDVGDVFRRLHSGEWEFAYSVPFVDRTQVTPCQGLAQTSVGTFVGCATIPGVMTVAKLTDSRAMEEPLPGASCNEPSAIAEVSPGEVMFVGCRTDEANINSVYIRDTAWRSRGQLHYGTGQVRHLYARNGVIYGFLHYGEALEVPLLTDGGSYVVLPRRLPTKRVFGSTAAGGGTQLLVGDVVESFFPDGGRTTIGDLTSLHPRLWNAAATLGNGALVVGMFGATAFFPFDGTPPQLLSSSVAMRPSDVCASHDGQAVYATFSGSPYGAGAYSRA